MSTILNAFNRRRREGESSSQPDLILERNAFHRELLRRASLYPARLRMIAIGLCAVGLVVVLTVAVLLINRRSDVGTTEAGSEIPALPHPQAVVEVVATPQPAQERPRPTSLVRPGRETVRLRTTPLPPTPRPVKITPLRAVAPTPRSTPAPTAAPTPQDIVTAQLAKDTSGILHLTGIVLNPMEPERSTALINGRIVRVGDVVEGARVVSIDSPYNVVVEYQGKKYTLELR